MTTVYLPSGIHTHVPADVYHDDRLGDTPSLSASIASILCSQSPAHAKAAHPRLNSYLVREEKKAFDLGTTVHALLLENRPAEEVIYVVEKDDWRTNAAKEAAEYARGQGLIPLLDKHNEDVLTMVAAARRKIAEFDPSLELLMHGNAEQTITWNEPGIACRSRVDHLRDDHAVICDVKTTSRVGGADRYAFERALYQHGYDVKAAFYLRGVKAVSGVAARFFWIVLETAAPYELSIIEPGPDVLTLGEDKVEYAMRVWKRCMASNEWPGYAREVVRAEMPAWAEAQWLERREAA